jgi:hypothetical protein
MTGTIIFLLVTLAVLSPVILIVLSMTSKNSTPSRVLKEQVPRYHQPRIAATGFSLSIGTETKTGKRLLIPQDTLTGHLLLLAPTRRGKSTLIGSLLDQILAEGVPIIIFDAQKAETENIIKLANRHSRLITVLPEQGYNPLRAGATPTQRAISFAEVFSQTSGLGAGEGQFYLQFAQLFIQTVLPLYEETYGQPMLLDELLDLLTSEQARKTLLDKARLSEAKHDFTIHFGTWTQNQIDKNLSGLILFIRRLADSDIKHRYNVRNAPTIDELISQNQVIIIREGGTKTNQYARARGLLFAVAVQKYVESRRIGEQPALPIIFDEAHLYFNNGFEDYLATCGKHGVINLIAFQNFAQAGDMQETIKTNSLTWIILGGLLADDAKVVADQIGYRLYTQSATSHAGDRNQIQEQLKFDYLYQPYQIQHLEAGIALILTVYNRANQPPRFVRTPTPVTGQGYAHMLDEPKPDMSVFRQ